MKRDELQRVRDWADRELTMGVNLPLARNQYIKLREAADAILFRMDSDHAVSVAPHLRLVDNAQHDLEADDWCLCPCDVEPSS